MLRISLLAVLALPLVATAQPTHQVKLNGHIFTLPKDFTIELAVGADLAPRPIACDFDEKGRLYVTDSSGSNAKVAEQVKEKPHRILRLESTKVDGKFDKQTVFVKNVMFPEGCMWLAGSLYVAAPPHIMKFTDTDDDGVADKEEIWFDGKTLTGCANDLHGPYRGPDGRIYWTKGAFAPQEYTLANGKKFTTRASHIFRATPDGKNIEPVMTGGMDNPVDLVFTPSGDIIFSTTFFQHPANGRRDGLVHAIPGAVYGKDHNVVYDHPWTSPNLMPPLTHMGPAAPCGLHRYESGQFGTDFLNNIFCCQFNLRKVSRHVLVPKGSTYETKDSDFVVSDNLDFHPTDVIEDADGSLLIVDTGGWYKLCCPTSQLVKPDVTGAIYRVRKVGAHKVDDPRGLKIDWTKAKPADLVKLLGDPRPVVRNHAIAHPVWKTRDEYDVSNDLRDTWNGQGTEVARLNCVWILARSGSSKLRPDLEDVANADSSPQVAQAAIRGLSLNRHPPLLGACLRSMTGKSPAVRRLSAEATGRARLATDLPALFEALADEKNDVQLDHALTYALIEIGNAAETAKGLTHTSPRVRRACLAALEFIPISGYLEAKTVLAELEAKDAALRETAWWIAGRHPQWGDQLAGYFKDRVKAADALKPDDRAELGTRLAKFVAVAAVQKVLAEAVIDDKPEPARLALGVMARSGLKALPGAWRDALIAAAPALDRDTLRAALAVFRALPTDAKDYDTFVTQLPRGKLWPGGGAPPEFRLALLAARPVNQSLDNAAMGFLVGCLDHEMPAADRSSAADILSRAQLSAAQLTQLTAALKTANPLELPKLIGAFDKSKDEKTGRALVAALRDKAVRPSVRAEAVKPILDKYPKTVKDEAEKLYTELAEARKGETARLDKLLADLKPGDVRRGQLVFNSAKTNCIACHKVGYVGGAAGPDLTRIGGIRTERDLLESIVFPSASFVRSYEPVRVVTKDERTLNGVLKKDAPDEIVIVVAADKEERVSRADVESIAPSTVSLMPAGMEQQLSAQELADLIAFLRACK